MFMPWLLAALTLCSLLRNLVVVEAWGASDDISLLQLARSVRLAKKERGSRSLLNKRDPLWRISLQGFSSDDMAHQERLVMNHLAKCGGSFVKDVLNKALPGNALHVENEEDSVTRYDLKGNNFIIGLIRNPLEYYVSLWAFTSEPTTCCFKDTLTAKQRDEFLGKTWPLGTTEEDRKRFKNFLFGINNKDLGTESLRFYGSYLFNWGNPHRAVTKDWHYIHANKPQVNSSIPNINQVLGNFTTTAPRQGPVDCWIRTEGLVDGLEACLVLYEDGIGKKVVDWNSFRRSLVTEDQNSADHVNCSLLYDQESLELVRSADRHIFRAFGYPDRC